VRSPSEKPTLVALENVAGHRGEFWNACHDSSPDGGRDRFPHRVRAAVHPLTNGVRLSMMRGATAKVECEQARAH
jgi:hypothetical protein